MSSQFRTVIDAEYNASRSTRLRWEKTVEFLAPAENVRSGLDMGDRTPLTGQLEKYFGCSFENSTGDLDTVTLKGGYDVVTSFEVIEHLFNPLYHLEQIRGVLNPGGRIYLSTPVGKPDFLWSPQHFHEMNNRSLAALLNRAGLTVIRRKDIKIQPPWFYFTGFRPMMRGLFEKHCLLELRPD